jgi:hypothetical protein
MSETDNSNIEKRLKQFDQAEKHFENILARLRGLASGGGDFRAVG